jgi:phenylacetic acid degradation operon negative regulatory protein
MLFTILADFVHPDREPVWTSTLLDVMKKGGFTEQAARQAIARAAADGWMTSERLGRTTRWRAGAALDPMFEAGRRRVLITGADAPPWDGRWLVVVMSIPHAQRRVRKKLYAALRWAGLGNPAPGLWLTPHTDRMDEVARVIDDAELQDSTVSFVGEPAAVGLDVDEVVRRAWDLEAVAASYRAVLSRFDGLDPAPGDPTLLAHLDLTDAVRHFPFMDPQLPEALVPDWIGREATTRLQRMRAALWPAAHTRWLEIVESTAPADAGSAVAAR